MHLKILCGLVCGIAIATTRAEVALETLLVTAPERVVSVPGISGEVQMDAAAQLPGLRIDSAELLQGIPGVQADSRSNYAQDTRVTLRGFGARSAFGVRGIDLLIDGVPLTTADGQGQISSVLLDEVSALKVLRGPVAALYGNGAGGVISLQTRPPTETLIRTRVLVGENDLSRRAVTGEWRADNFGARVYTADLTTDGERAHSKAERRHAGAQFYYTSADGVEAILRLDTNRDPLLQDPLGLTPEQWREDAQQSNPLAEQFDTRKEVSHRQMSLTLRESQGDGRWQTVFWRGSRDIKQYLGFSGATSAGGVVDLEREFTGVNGNYSYDFSLSGTPMTATLGAEVAGMEDHRRGYINNFGTAGDLRRDETGEVLSRDLYSLLQWQPAERWHVFGGVRHSDSDFKVDDHFIVTNNSDDSSKKDFAEWSSAMGISYVLNEAWSFFVSAGRGFETPTLTEAAYRNDNSGVNTALDASSNRQRELGVRFNEGETAEFVVTLFRIDSTDEIVVDQSFGGRTTYRNAAATERQGVEFSGDVTADNGWSARVSASYIDADYSRGEWKGMQLPGVARSNHYAQLRWQPWQDERLTIALAGQYRSQVATGDDNQTFAPAATTADLALSSRHSLEEWQFSSWLKLGNITDERYVGSVIVNQGNGRSFEPAAGRNLSGGIEVAYSF